MYLCCYIKKLYYFEGPKVILFAQLCFYFEGLCQLIQLMHSASCFNKNDPFAFFYDLNSFRISIFLAFSSIFIILTHQSKEQQAIKQIDSPKGKKSFFLDPPKNREKGEINRISCFSGRLRGIEYDFQDKFYNEINFNPRLTLKLVNLSHRKLYLDVVTERSSKILENTLFQFQT